jgi:hypothetical protein
MENRLGFEHIIGNLTDHLIPGHLLQTRIAKQTALQETNFMGLNGHRANQLTQLFGRIIGFQADHRRLSTPALIASDQQEAAFPISIDLLWPIQACVMGVEAQGAQPLGQFPQHDIGDETLFRNH